MKLDIGCGGNLLFRDHTELNLENDRWVFADIRPCSSWKPTVFIMCSVTNLPFVDLAFDYGVCIDVLEHIEYSQLKSACNDLRRVCKSLKVRVPRFWTNNKENLVESGHKTFILFSKFYPIRNKSMMRLLAHLLCNRFIRSIFKRKLHMNPFVVVKTF
jgi:ubiquinone/menaquinone biosynthesis C-methylase UbiE